jgi:hypothetical protein
MYNYNDNQDVIMVWKIHFSLFLKRISKTLEKHPNKCIFFLSLIAVSAVYLKFLFLIFLPWSVPIY